MTTNSKIEHLFSKNTTFSFNDFTYKVLFSGKPTSSVGNPQTDFYVLIEDIKTSSRSELKITFKDPLESLLEEKINSESSKGIFGDNWANILTQSASRLKNTFEENILVFKNKKGRVNAGSIILGWKLEFSNNPTTELSEKLVIDSSNLSDIYAGNNLPVDIKNSFVNGVQIPNCGVANMILDGNIEDFNTTESLFLNLSTINTYAFKNNNLHFTYKPFNYRSFKGNFDGNRPLAVSVDWSTNNGKLNPTLNFDTPLLTKGNEVANKLVSSLNELNIKNTDDIVENNIVNFDKLVY